MPTAEQVLTCPMNPGDNDAGVGTVRDYLLAQLAALWEQKDGFSGKRPLGNSGWDYDVYKALIKAGLMDGTLDEDGYVDRVDESYGDALIQRAIEYMRVMA